MTFKKIYIHQEPTYLREEAQWRPSEPDKGTEEKKWPQGCGWAGGPRAPAVGREEECTQADPTESEARSRGTW